MLWLVVVFRLIGFRRFSGFAVILVYCLVNCGPLVVGCVGLLWYTCLFGFACLDWFVGGWFWCLICWFA